MENNRINNDFAIKHLASNLMKHIFPDGAFDVANCLQIGNFLKDWDVQDSGPVGYQRIDQQLRIPSVDELKFRLQLSSRGVAKILHFLMSNSGNWKNIEDISQNLNFSLKSIRVHISMLRKSLRENDLSDIIVTEYNAGYSISESSLLKLLGVIRAERVPTITSSSSDAAGMVNESAHAVA